MIRSIIISALFFFGPALLMFMLRNMFLVLRSWLKARKQHAQEAEVIDITPDKPSGPSVLFVSVAIIVGLVCAVLAWQEMSSTPNGQQHYVPAHTDSQGNIVPGHYIPSPKNIPSD